MRKSYKFGIMLAAILLCLPFAACGARPDYSEFAGTYTLHGATGAAFADFAYAELILRENGEYNFNYSYQDTQASMDGEFTAEENVITFTGELNGTAEHHAGYFMLTVIWQNEQAQLLFALS